MKALKGRNRLRIGGVSCLVKLPHTPYLRSSVKTAKIAGCNAEKHRTPRWETFFVGGVASSNDTHRLTTCPRDHYIPGIATHGCLDGGNDTTPHHRHGGALEAVDFDGLVIETESVVLVGKELLDLVALITLELDHLSHSLGIGVVNDGAIASCDGGENKLACLIHRTYGGKDKSPKATATYRTPS